MAGTATTRQPACGPREHDEATKIALAPFSSLLRCRIAEGRTFTRDRVGHRTSPGALHPHAASMITTRGNLGGFGKGRMQSIGEYRPAGDHRCHHHRFPSNGDTIPRLRNLGTAMPVPLDARSNRRRSELRQRGEDATCWWDRWATLYNLSSHATGTRPASQCWRVGARPVTASNRGEIEPGRAGVSDRAADVHADEILRGMQVPAIWPRIVHTAQCTNGLDAGTEHVCAPGQPCGGPSGPEASVLTARLRCARDFP